MSHTVYLCKAVPLSSKAMECLHDLHLVDLLSKLMVIYHETTKLMGLQGNDEH